MAIDLFELLTGSQWLKDKIQRNEHVIRILKRVGLDPEHPPKDFEGVYQYALVEYGVVNPCHVGKASPLENHLSQSSWHSGG